MNGHLDKNLVAAFRQHLPDLSTPRFTTARKQSATEYREAFQEAKYPPWIYGLTEMWKGLLEEPYHGVTIDGTVREGLFQLEDGGAPIGEIVKATNNTLSKLSPELRDQVRFPMSAKQWRCWSNPEFYLRPFGLRLEELPEETAESFIAIIEASFSAEGFQKALAAMRINHFLGECCDLPTIMNKYSYNFLIYGEPSETEAWGWSLYGHHLCLNTFLKGSHIVISPTFTGAEPNLIDRGPWAGTAILHREGDIGLKLMQSLTKEQQTKAVIFKLMRDPAMKQTGDLKTDRWNQDDQRHVCGAFRDNRIVPYEGQPVSEFTPEQQQLLLDIADEMTLYLPTAARKKRLEQMKKHFSETYFVWIGSYGDQDSFYFRIQSPVIILEFDHHSGVFLTNTEPAKFHTHTIVRTPNAGDYGQALRKDAEKLK